MVKEQKLVEGAEQQMEPGERIVAAVGGAYETKIMGNDSVRNGVLIATDRRVVFYAKKMGGFDLESYPYASISSIDQGKNLMGHTVSIYAAGNRIDVKWIKDATKLGDFMNTAKANVHAKTTTPMQQPLAPPLAPPQADSVADELLKLKQLVDAGVLTDDEFAAQKARLLGR